MLARVLGLIHQGIGKFDGLIGRIGRVREDCHSDAEADRPLVAAHRIVKSATELLYQFTALLHICFRHQRDKFVTAEACH